MPKAIEIRQSASNIIMMQMQKEVCDVGLTYGGRPDDRRACL